MGSHTGCSERHPYKHYWICRKNKLVRIVLREMLGKVWHILLSSWADPTAVTPRCHCFQGCCWDLCSCSSLWSMGHSSAASSSLRERSWQFLTLLYCKVFLLAPQSPLRENNHCKVYVSTPSCIALRENMVRLGPSEVLFPVVSKVLFLTPASVLLNVFADWKFFKYWEKKITWLSYSDLWCNHVLFLKSYIFHQGILDVLSAAYFS